MDVEIDKDLHYRIGHPISYKNVYEAIPNLLEPLFKEYGVRPTYLLSSEIIQDKQCINVLKNLKTEHELGTHGHAEFLGEKIDILKSSGRLLREFVSDYPFEQQFSMLAWLTEIFYQAFGYAPKSFRGGRFGVNIDTIKILEKLQYKVESSVTPGTFWESDKQLLNFISAPEQPYCPAVDDITNRGNSVLLEVPISCWPAHACSKYLQNFLAHRIVQGRAIPLILTRILKKTIATLHWLRPTLANPRILRKWIEEYIKRHSHNPVMVINIMFHPIEMVAGASPYAKTSTQVDRIMTNLRAMLAYLKTKDADFVTLSQVPEYYSASK
jgi:hypothetical protein